MIQHINNKEEFDNVINNNENVLIYCSLSHCGPCKIIGPKFNELDNKYENFKKIKIVFDELLDDDEDYIKDKLNIQKYPTIVIIYKNKLEDSFIGRDINPVLNKLDFLSEDWLNDENF
jgi:thioredoxin 1